MSSITISGKLAPTIAVCFVYPYERVFKDVFSHNFHKKKPEIEKLEERIKTLNSTMYGVTRQ